MTKILLAALACLAGLAAGLAHAEIAERSLEISFKTLNISGKPARAMLLNGAYPGPALRFKEGDRARIHVTNSTDVDTSVHWHGLLVPPSQDGVPYVSNFPIGPGETFTYEFPLRQAGTYWYHSHTDLQEQSGVHGALVIEPRQAPRPALREAVVVLQDWTDEDPEQVLHNLKKDGHYYSRKKRAVISLAEHLRRGALGAWWDNRWIRMGGMDLSDVGYDAFLANGQRELRLFPDAAPGERVRLRLVNAATSTYFVLHGKALPLTVVAADGLDTAPVEAEEILHAVAETYDLLVTLPEQGAVELRASAQDGTGHASIILGQGQVRRAEPLPKPDLYQSHAGMMHAEAGHGAMHGGHDMHGGHGEHSGHAGHDGHGGDQGRHHGQEASGGRLAYRDLRTLDAWRHLGEGPVREVSLRLTGDMETFNWTFNNVPLSRADKIRIQRGETVRFAFVNETMMHHPLHLHGHFFRVVTGPEAGPVKHTVDVPPMGEVVIEFFANETEDWFFHCHNLYHAKTGMGRIIRYADYAGNPAFERAKMQSPDITDRDWYWRADLSLLSRHARAEGWFANARHQLEWEAEFPEAGHDEAEVAYLHRQSRFFQWLVAAEKEEGEATEYRAGLRYLLPLMVELDLYATDGGRLEAALGTEVQLTEAVKFHGEWETTQEYRFSLEYRLGDGFALEVAHFDDVNVAAGVQLRF